MADTLAAVRGDLHALAIKVAEGHVRSEERHDAILTALSELRKDLSDQGKTPRPAEPRTGMARILPESWTPLNVVNAILVIVAVAGGAAVGGQIGGTSGAAGGAQQAVEDAVELGKAAPVAVPAPVRIVPVPIPVPVPVPVEPERPPNDLLPRGEP